MRTESVARPRLTVGTGGGNVAFRRPLLPLWLGLVALALGLGGAVAQEDLAVNGSFSQGLEGWRIRQDATCITSFVNVEAGPYRRALRLVLKPAAEGKPWDINLHQGVDGMLRQGDRVQIKVWLRSPERCRLAAYLEIAQDPWTKSLSASAQLTPEWQEYTFEGRCLQDFNPDQANVGFHLGYDAGVIELAGFRLLNLDAKPDPGGARGTMDQPVSLIRNGDFSGDLKDNWGYGDGERLKVTPFAAQVDRFTRAVRLEVNPPPEASPWTVQFGQVCAAGVRKGDAVYFRAWLRSPDQCRVGFVYEMATPPHTKYIMQVVAPTPEWKEYRFLGYAPSSFPAGGHQAKFFLGYGKGTVEVAGVSVQSHGPAPAHRFDQTLDFWGGRPHPDDWRGPALQRIEQLRKGDLVIKVVDAAGKPVPGATVKVEQQRHHFRFGTAAPASRFLDTTNPDNVRFQQEVARLFNTVTFENDLKWVAVGEGSLRTQLAAADWLKAHDLDLRGHCLVWGSYRHLPPAVRELRGAALAEAILAHVTDYATRWRGKLYLWDVVNEAGSNTEVWDEVGWESFAEVFRRARAADPQARLCYNDYNISQEDAGYRNKVRARIKYLLERNVPLDVLGDQGHMSLPLTPLHRVLEIWDEWAAFGKDLEITEFDLGCPDDKVHAEYTRDYLIAAFSHPAMKSFIFWGFWEGSHWRAKDGGAMVRQDWSKRPALEAYEDLVFRQWWTRWEGRSAADGAARLRAFYGRHRVTAEAGDKRGEVTVQLLPGTSPVVEVRLP